MTKSKIHLLSCKAIVWQQDKAIVIHEFLMHAATRGGSMSSQQVLMRKTVGVPRFTQHGFFFRLPMEILKREREGWTIEK